MNLQYNAERKWHKRTFLSCSWSWEGCIHSTLSMTLVVGFHRWPLSHWRSLLLFPVCWVFLSLNGIRFGQMLFLQLLRRWCGFCSLVYQYGVLHRFSDIKPILHSCNKSYLISVIILIWGWIQFAIIVFCWGLFVSIS